MRFSIRLVSAAGAFTCVPSFAHAHLVDTRLGDFYGGALHPLTEFQQILPWIALAVLAAFQEPQRARWITPAFPAALLAGALAALILPEPPFASALGLALVAVTGLAVAAAARVPLAILLGITVLTGLLHGYQNGATMVASTDQFLFLCGMTTVGYVVITLATGSAVAFLHGVGGWGAIALRAGGSWVAAVGIMVLGLHLVTPR